MGKEFAVFLLSGSWKTTPGWRPGRVCHRTRGESEVRLPGGSLTEREAGRTVWRARARAGPGPASPASPGRDTPGEAGDLPGGAVSRSQPRRRLGPEGSQQLVRS